MSRSELIDRYLRNELVGDELTDFEALLRTDSELAEEVNIYRGVMQSLADRSSAATEKILTEIHQDRRQKQSSGKNPGKYYFVRKYAVAATVLLLVAFSIVLYFTVSQEPLSNAQLADRYFEPAKPEQVRAGDSATAEEKLLERAFMEYNYGNFDSAQLILTGLAQNNPDWLKVNFFLGQCYLALDQPQEAISYFQRILETGDNLYVNRTEWYLALACLKAEKQKEAVDLLRKVVSKNSSYSSKAEELLKALKE